MKIIHIYFCNIFSADIVLSIDMVLFLYDLRKKTYNKNVNMYSFYCVNLGKRLFISYYKTNIVLTLYK